MDRRGLIKLAGERSVIYRESGCHCAEAVIRGVAETLGIQVDPRVFRVARGFTGGTREYHDRCGALAGGAILIGIVFGRQHSDEDNTCPSDLTNRLHAYFAKTFGTTTCRLIVRPAEGQLAEHCTQDIYRRAAEKVAELILDAHKLCYTCEEFKLPSMTPQGG